MAKKLYEVKLTRGKNNKNWHKFYNNIDGLNGKGPDYGGINNVAIVVLPQNLWVTDLPKMV